MTTITTSTGTVIRVTQGGVRMSNPNLPPRFQDRLVGRIVNVDGVWAFQAARFSSWALTPEALRTVATLIDGVTDDE